MIQSRRRTTHLAFILKDFRVAISGTWVQKKLTRRWAVVVSWLHLCVLCFAPKYKEKEKKTMVEDGISMANYYINY